LRYPEVKNKAFECIRDFFEALVKMSASFMQIWGTAKNHGLEIKTFHLQEAKGWAPDLAELEEGKKRTDRARRSFRLGSFCANQFRPAARLSSTGTGLDP
jgi:hypothetical protein